MEAEHEELAANPLFSELLKQTKLLARVVQDKALVCVPSSESLKLCQLTSDFLCTHILVADASMPDAYFTLNGKRVTFKPSDGVASPGRVVCGEGFARPRTVMIIYEELFYDDDFNTIKMSERESERLRYVARVSEVFPDSFACAVCPASCVCAVCD
jgi:hypothetical protein